MANQKKPKKKYSPKLVELTKWKYIDVVNQMLDSGESPQHVSDYINSKGFKISHPLVYDYAKLRRQAIVSHISINHLLGVASNGDVRVEPDPSFDKAKYQLKSEIDMLDEIINKGYTDWRDIFINKPVTMNMTMAAIRMKNELTAGSNNFLTNYGLDQLRELERNKYDMLIQIIMSYVPEEVRPEVYSKVEEAEDEYYQNTDYYIEYLRAKGYTDEEINKRIYELEKQKKDNPVNEDEYFDTGEDD
jgi:hypothetical protein